MLFRSGRYGEKDLDRLILGGVTPVEQVGGTVSVVRGVTTRTATGAAADPTWRDLATIRVVDDVIPSLRQALAAKFRRAKNTPQSRGAIRAQVVLELEQKLSREIITGYEDVAVSADPVSYTHLPHFWAPEPRRRRRPHPRRDQLCHPLSP